MVVSPVCVVSKAHFLTRSGWMATDNATASEADLPFALARDAGRTHLQVSNWSHEENVTVQSLDRKHSLDAAVEVSYWSVLTELYHCCCFFFFKFKSLFYLQWLGEPRLRSLMEGRIVLVRLLCKDTANQRIGVFSPCIAFRVAGSPGKAAFASDRFPR